MRIVAAITLPCVLLVAACTSSETVVVAAGTDGGEEAASDGSAGDVPTTIAETATTTTSPEAVAFDPSDYLLTHDDLPGWKFVRQMNFAPEPTFDVVDCDPMLAAWSAHAAKGTRIRASTEGASLRHTVVEMPDAESAESVIDGADVVWRECNPLTLESSSWWVEPIQVPAVDGWQSAGVALGVSEEYVWSIAWFQQDSTVVFLDLDSENPWEVIDPVLEAVAGRLAGNPSPVPAPEPHQTSTTSTPPTTTPGERPPSTTVPRNPDEEWKNHPAAVYVPDASLFGSGFRRTWVRVEEPEPSDSDDVIDGCPVDPPPTMSGLGINYEHESDTIEVEVVIGIDNQAWAQATIDSFRALGGCSAEALDVDTLAVVEPESEADDAVVVRLTFADETGPNRGLILVSRYGDMMIALIVGAETGGPVDVPTFEELIRWANKIAASA